MGIVETTRKKIALAFTMERQKMRVTFARIPRPFRSAFVTIYEEIHFARQSRERRHHRATVVVFDDEFRNKDRVREIRERVVEALARMHAAQRVEISGRVFADEHDLAGTGPAAVGTAGIRGLSKYAMAQERMNAPDRFRCVEGRGTRWDTVMFEGRLSSGRNRLLCEGVRQGLEHRVIIER